MTQQELLALLAGATAPVAPAQAKPAGTAISGPIVGLANGARIGDCRIRTVPAGIKWVRQADKNGKPFVRSATVYSATAFIGEHGGAWADPATLADTGIPYESGVSTTAFDLEAALKSTEPTGTAPAAPAEEPAI